MNDNAIIQDLSVSLSSLDAENKEYTKYRTHLENAVASVLAANERLLKSYAERCGILEKAKKSVKNADIKIKENSSQIEILKLKNAFFNKFVIESSPSQTIAQMKKISRQYRQEVDQISKQIQKMIQQNPESQEVQQLLVERNKQYKELTARNNELRKLRDDAILNLVQYDNNHGKELQPQLQVLMQKVKENNRLRKDIQYTEENLHPREEKDQYLAEQKLIPTEINGVFTDGKGHIMEEKEKLVLQFPAEVNSCQYYELLDLLTEEDFNDKSLSAVAFGASLDVPELDEEEKKRVEKEMEENRIKREQEAKEEAEHKLKEEEEKKLKEEEEKKLKEEEEKKLKEEEEKKRKEEEERKQKEEEEKKRKEEEEKKLKEEEERKQKEKEEKKRKKEEEKKRKEEEKKRKEEEKKRKEEEKKRKEEEKKRKEEEKKRKKEEEEKKKKEEKERKRKEKEEKERKQKEEEEKKQKEEEEKKQKEEEERKRKEEEEKKKKRKRKSHHKKVDFGVNLLDSIKPPENNVNTEVMTDESDLKKYNDLLEQQKQYDEHIKERALQKITKLRSELNELDNAIDTAKEKKRTIKQRHSDMMNNLTLQTNLETIDREPDSSKNNVVDAEVSTVLRKSIEELKAEIAEKNARASESFLQQQQTADLRDRAAKLELELNVIRLANDRKTADLQSYADRLKTVDAIDYITRPGSKKDSQPVIVEQEKINRRKERLKGVDKILKQREADLQALERKVVDLQTINESINKEIKEKTRQPKMDVKAMCDNLKICRRHMREYSRQAEFLKIENDALQDQIVRLNTKYNQTTEASLKEKTEQLNQQLAKAKQRFFSIKGVLNSNVTLTSEDELLWLQVKTREINDAISVIQMRAGSVATKIDKQQKQCRELRIPIPEPPPHYQTVLDQRFK